jgi:hypothetical protein
MKINENSSIEMFRQLPERDGVHYALFDFDGTLSLIREGWQAIMIPMMIEILMQTPAHEDKDTITTVVRDFGPDYPENQRFQMIN